MGMSIDEAIRHLERILVNEKENQFYAFSTTSISVAIETMRKYQQIVQIMERTVDDGTSMYDTLQEIEEVIEDGSN